MDGIPSPPPRSKTYIRNPETGQEKLFEYDHSFQTFAPDCPEAGPYASQVCVASAFSGPCFSPPPRAIPRSRVANRGGRPPVDTPLPLIGARNQTGRAARRSGDSQTDINGRVFEPVVCASRVKAHFLSNSVCGYLMPRPPTCYWDSGVTVQWK